MNTDWIKNKGLDTEGEKGKKLWRKIMSIPKKGSYRVLCGSQNLLNHHTVPCKRAPVERVGPIRTEGAEATCYHATQSRGQQQMTGRGTQQAKGKESITTCNLQGTSFFYLVDKKVQWKIERGGRVCSWARTRYCSRLFRDGNESEVTLFALKDRRKEDEQNTERWLFPSFPYEGVVSVQHEHRCNYAMCV